mmetsp:Transcript_22323/g.34558  ORF Transcript_22323/g.34558 Transcript_22323/m.34558 type:complete len:122 (-) Transcript_22323:1919-2284(-)
MVNPTLTSAPKTMTPIEAKLSKNSALAKDSKKFFEKKGDTDGGKSTASKHNKGEPSKTTANTPKGELVKKEETYADSKQTPSKYTRLAEKKESKRAQPDEGSHKELRTTFSKMKEAVKRSK